MNGEEPAVDLNGHIPVRKRYIESSLDELAMEIEAYEANEERPKPVEYYHNGDNTDEPDAAPESPKKPPAPIVVITTPEAGPSYEKVEIEEPVEEPAKTPVEVQWDALNKDNSAIEPGVHVIEIGNVRMLYSLRQSELSVIQ